MTAPGTYLVPFTGPQLRVMREILAAIANDPGWAEYTGRRDWRTLERATETVVSAHVDACRAESTPAR